MRLPLSALLSQAFVAFVIEFDNEFEHQTPHRTTRDRPPDGSRSAPWLLSTAMWIKFLQFVPDDEITVLEFKHRSALTTKELKVWLTRMSKRWGYVRVVKNGEDPRTWLIRPSPGGQKALRVWRPLTGIIERRWEERFGKDTVDELRHSMHTLRDRLDGNLPGFLPILGYHMLSGSSVAGRPLAPPFYTPFVPAHALLILFSQLLLTCALEFERESHLSLAISANVLRLASEQGVRVRDLPRLSGVSKEAVAMAVKRLEQGGFGLVQAGIKDNRARVLHLTEKGRHARDTYFRLVWELERRWESAFGPCVATLRRSLERLRRQDASGAAALMRGLDPYPDCWRASIRRPEELPHFPMILHRGGYPDGS